MLCDGSAVSRDTYATLFATVGTTYGAGDGSTTFTLPDLVDKFVEGSATAGTEHSAGLPNITGGVNYFLPVSETSTATGAFGWGDTTSSRTVSDVGNNIPDYFTIDASRSSSIYGNSATVQPPALTMRPFIYTGKTSQYKWLRTA